VSTIDFPADLIELERSAWAAIQAGTLTTGQALAVHAGVIAFAEQAGMERREVEEQLKRVVRHPEPAEG
jgi:predicted transcriptional regulator